MKLRLQAIQAKTFISLTLSAQKLGVCLRDRWWEMGKNADVHAMCVQKKRGTIRCFELPLDWVECATLSIFFSALKYDIFH